MLSEAIPHGTREGYAAGCRGSKCMGVESVGMSCRQASVRYSSDLSYRRRIDAGLSAAVIWAEDQLDAAATPAADGSAVDLHGNGYAPSTVTVADSETPLDAFDDEPVLATEVVEGADLSEPDVADVVEDPDELIGGVPLSKHGTKAGYYAGCRMRDECPAKASTGVSCANAVAAHQRAKRGEPAAAPAVDPVEVEAEVERRVDDVAGALADAGTLVVQLEARAETADREAAIARQNLATAEAELVELRNHFDVQEQRVREVFAEHARVVEDYKQRNAHLTVELDKALAAAAERGELEVRDGGVELLEPIGQARLKVVPVGGGALVEYDGVGRVELSFYEGGLQHAAVSTS